MIVAGCRPAVVASEAWLLCPCERHALDAHGVASGAEARAEAANAASTVVGDWWSCQAVQTAHFIPATIAEAAGLPDPDPVGHFYGPGPGLTLCALLEFAGFPSNVTRTPAQAMGALMDEVVPLAARAPRPRCASGPQARRNSRSAFPESSASRCAGSRPAWSITASSRLQA